MSRRRKIAIAASIALGLAILLPVIRHYQLRFAVESYIARLKAEGEPMDLAQVIPPPTPSAQNGVPLIINALTNLAARYSDPGIVQTNPPRAMQMIAPGKAMIGWQEPMIIGNRGIAKPSATNTWKALGRELTSVKSDLDSFQSLTNHPVLDFNLNYAEYQNLKLAHLGWLKISAQFLGISALYHLHLKDQASACAELNMMLALVKGDHDERPIVSQLIRIAMATIAASDTWEILQEPDVSDDELAQLQLSWQALEFVTPVEATLQFERVSDIHEFSATRTSTKEFNQFWGYYFAPTAPIKNDLDQLGPIRRSQFKRKWDELQWRLFWSYQDELFGLQSLQVAIDATRMAETNQSFKAVQSLANAELEPINARRQHSVSPMNGLRSAFSANAVFTVLRKAIIIETARNVVVTAIALKRYELRNHRLPDALNRLVPDFLETVPTDYMDGQPLRYRRNADGTFALYSVGENGVDDGGNPSLEKGVMGSNFYWQNLHALDWVWPQPATFFEIHRYYE